MQMNSGQAEGSSGRHSGNENELMLGDVADPQEDSGRLRITQFCLDNAADAIFRIEADARIVYANETACRSLGWHYPL